MAYFPKSAANTQLFFVSIQLCSQKEGIDLINMCRKLSSLLCDYSTATKVIYKFKVSGESRILSVVQASNIIGLERTLGGLCRQGAVEVECVPLLNYENFARSIKVGDHLTGPNSGSLSKEGLYWMQFDVGYSGKTTEELISIWRKEAEAVLTARHKEGTSLELYKVVAQRKVHVFINAADPEQVDLLSLQLPIMKENGSNVKIECRAVQMLDEYVSRITQEAI